VAGSFVYPVTRLEAELPAADSERRQSALLPSHTHDQYDPRGGSSDRKG
jgi:hypothetical protein